MDTEQEQWIIALDAIRGEIQWKKMMNQGGYPKVNHPKNTEATSSLARTESDCTVFAASR